MNRIKDPYKALEFTQTILQSIESDTWLIPQSGGKDSRSVAWAALILIAEGRVNPPKRLVTWFSDTLMEYPSFISQARQALDEFVGFARKLGVEAHSFITRPKPEHDFWVRVIGKGLLPPTGNMRWCTGYDEDPATQRCSQKTRLVWQSGFIGGSVRGIGPTRQGVILHGGRRMRARLLASCR